MNTQYQALVAHAAEIVSMPNGDGVDTVAGYVAESHSQTIIDKRQFKNDVRRAYIALRMSRIVF